MAVQAAKSSIDQEDVNKAIESFNTFIEPTKCGEQMIEEFLEEHREIRLYKVRLNDKGVDFIIDNKTNDLSESQPTKGNIAGGLTTIEEKAFGNLQKIGRKTEFIDVLEPAEDPVKGAGLYFMDTSSAAAECVTCLLYTSDAADE